MSSFQDVSKLCQLIDMHKCSQVWSGKGKELSNCDTDLGFPCVWGRGYKRHAVLNCRSVSEEQLTEIKKLLFPPPVSCSFSFCRTNLDVSWRHFFSNHSSCSVLPPLKPPTHSFHIGCSSFPVKEACVVPLIAPAMPLLCSAAESACLSSLF